MIYTSYFAQMKNFPITFIPISICGGVPSWYTGTQYKKVAPKWAFFQEWKKNHDNDFYISRFNNEVLAPLEPIKVLNEIHNLLPDKLKAEMQEPVWRSEAVHVVLLCYEKPEDFCHRHLVADWINEAAGKELIKEWNKSELDCKQSEAQ